MPTTLPARAARVLNTAKPHPALWRVVVGLLLVKPSRYAFRIAERLCRAAERVARDR